jgi:tetratricopeptide (TPR) repeat protein
MEAGEYQKALEEYGVRYRKHPGDQALTKQYVKSVEEMKAAADKACDEKEYATAGRIYDLLLKRYAQFKNFAHMLTFNKAYLDQKLSLCKKSLSVMGFQEYRKGNLNEAITMWRGLLMIDPHNEDIRKALNTATEQQKNLQTKK